VRFEWDYRKQRTNLEKHGIEFADALAVFEDLLAMTLPSSGAEEDRFTTLGVDGFGRLLVVVYTWREDAIRLISARRATRRERSRYEATG
jgi:uncharacterized protein